MVLNQNTKKEFSPRNILGTALISGKTPEALAPKRARRKKVKE